MLLGYGLLNRPEPQAVPDGVALNPAE
jgi:hypothetical protein